MPRVCRCLTLVCSAGCSWFLGGCSAPPETPHLSQSIQHVVLISIDTCRADYLSCYEHSRTSTPNIDRVAGEGFLFTHAVSPVPLTLPAHSTMLTGTNPPAHGVRDNLNYHLHADNLTLAEILREQGFATGAVVSAFVMDARFGLQQGFASYHDDFGGPLGVAIPPWDQRRASQTSQLGIEWLKTHRDEKSFLFLHYFDPHGEYDPPEPFASRYADNPYEGEICYVDQCIGQVINALKELGIYDSTLLIITADHGEMLGEHGEDNHSYFVYRSVLRVPLIFRVPGGQGQRPIEDAVGLVDIVPTVCRLLAIEPPAGLQGVALTHYFQGGDSSPAGRHYYAESLTPTKYGASALLL